MEAESKPAEQRSTEGVLAMTRQFEMNLGDPWSMPGLTEASGITVPRQYDQPDQLQTLEDLLLRREETQHYKWTEFLMMLSFYMSLVETTSTAGLHSLNDRVQWGESLLVLIDLLESATRAEDPCPMQASHALSELMVDPPNYAKLLENLAIDIGAFEQGTLELRHLAPYIMLLQSVAGDLLSV